MGRGAREEEERNMINLERIQETVGRRLEQVSLEELKADIQREKQEWYGKTIPDNA